MKSILKSFGLVALLALCANAWADAVAKIGTTEYSTLADAVKAANAGETVTLLANVELSEGLLVTAARGALTIDLNGKTLTGADETYAIRVTNAGRLTVKNGTIQLGIGWDNWAWGIDNRGGTLDVVGVTFKGAGADYYGDFVTANWDWDYVVQEYNSEWDEWETVGLKNGAQFGVTTLKDCTIGFYGPEYECFSYQEFGGQCTKLIVEGGTYECMFGSNMFNPLELCGLEIRGGTFKRNAEHYYEPVRYASITGGEVHFAGDEVFDSCYVMDGSVCLDGGTINLAGIAGGTFVGAGKIEMEAARTITGGTFSREIWEAKSIAMGSKGYEEMPTLGYYYMENADGSCTVQQVGTVKVSIQSTNTGCGTIGISAYTIGKTTWKKSTYGSPKESVSKVEATKGGAISFTATATPKENYRFKGWFDNAVGSGQAISIEPTLENFKHVVQNDVTIYAVFELNSVYAERVAAAKAWYDAGVAGGGLTISSIAEWKLFADAVNLNAGSFAGKLVTLAANLDFTGLEYEPVGSQAFAFNGTFDGGAHTICGVRIEAAKQAGYVGIFGNAIGTIKNLNATGCSVTGGYCAGIIVGEGRTVVNCHVTASEIGQDCYFGGGVMGHSYLMNLDNVSFESGTVTNGFKVGAIAGYGDYVTLKNATVQGNELSGGAAGLIHHVNAEYATIKNIKVDQRDNPLIGTTYGVPVVINLGADSTANTEVWASEIVGLQGQTGVTFDISSGIYNLASEEAVNEAKALVPSAELLEEEVVIIRLIPTARPGVEVRVVVPEVVPVTTEGGEEVPEAVKEAAATVVTETKTAISGNTAAVEVADTGLGKAIFTAVEEGGEEKKTAKSDIAEGLTAAVQADVNLTDEEKEKAIQQIANSEIDGYVNVRFDGTAVSVVLPTAEVQAKVTLTTITYEVQPISAVTVVTKDGEGKVIGSNTVEKVITNEQLARDNVTVSFRLPLTDDFTKNALVQHEGDPDRIVKVLGVPGGRYIALEATHFSPFKISKTDEEVPVELVNEDILGIVRYTGGVKGRSASEAKEYAVGVPWLGREANGSLRAGVTVDSLITKNGLKEGDELSVWMPNTKTTENVVNGGATKIDNAVGSYAVYRWSGTAWEGVLDADTCKAAPNATTTVVDRGAAVWYKRVPGDDNDFTLIGIVSNFCVSAVAPGTTTKPTMSLMTNPFPDDAVDATRFTGCQDGDQLVLLNEEGDNAVYNYKGGWGNYVTTTVRGHASTKWQAATSLVIPAGKSFWYVSRSANVPQIDWKAAKVVPSAE